MHIVQCCTHRAVCLRNFGCKLCLVAKTTYVVVEIEEQRLLIQFVPVRLRPFVSYQKGSLYDADMTYSFNTADKDRFYHSRRLYKVEVFERR